MYLLYVTIHKIIRFKNIEKHEIMHKSIVMVIVIIILKNNFYSELYKYGYRYIQINIK